MVTITSVRFRNFKALGDFGLSFGAVTVLVGPNNAGKSTILSAFRLLASGIRHARSKSPSHFMGPDGTVQPGYLVGAAGSAVSLENVHTDLSDRDTSVTFRLSNGNSMRLYFPLTGGCVLFCDGPTRAPRSPTEFRAQFPVTIGSVPVLGPVEYREPVLKRETVTAALGTPRASRHFRNFWHLENEGFHDFATVLAQTWPGMEIEPPEIQFSGTEVNLVMFCREQRMTRELYWAGFGFQVWCQLLTHILRSTKDTLLLIDEPEIYLHPDLQRQLVHILRTAGPDILLATHSTEILNEAEPSEIVIVDKQRTSGHRLSNASDVQGALRALGSNHNVELAHLARHRRVLFVEGGDFGLIRRFARKLGLSELANGAGLTVVPISGFSGWARLRDVAWGFEKILGTKLRLGVVLDRDFRSEEEISAIGEELRTKLDLVHFHQCKELENHLLCPSAIQKALNLLLADRGRRTGVPQMTPPTIEQMVTNITELGREEWRGQYQASRAQWLRGTGRDLGSLNADTSRWFERQWQSLEARLRIVHGKRVLTSLMDAIQLATGMSLSHARIVAAMAENELHDDLVKLLRELDGFRASGESELPLSGIRQVSGTPSRTRISAG